MSDPSNERVEVVDLDGEVESVVSRAEMRRDGLRHRCSYVAVLRLSGKLVVHQRAAWKDTSPLLWDICFGGVVDVGESWKAAATRELLEEAGLDAASDLLDLGPVRFEGRTTKVVGHAYLLVSDDVVSCPDGEVVTVEEVSVDNMGDWLAEHEVCEDSLEVVLPLIMAYLRKHLKSL